MKEKFFNVRDTIAAHPDCYYYMFIGERSNGKTYSALQMALENYFKKGEQFAYIRRYGEDIRPKQLKNLFSSHIENGALASLSGGMWNSISYATGRFYLQAISEGADVVKSEEPIGYAFDLNSMEHYKSISFPRVTTVIFDEFLSRNGYLPSEFILFTNTLSTIIRLRNNVKILMLGNTVNKYCPYFTEMGLSHVKDQKQGTVDIYTYGDSKLKVAVEYCESSKKTGGKKSDVYFAFDNPELHMITGGAWEISIYPHLTTKYLPKEVVYQVFFDFDCELLHGEVVCKEDTMFLFVHRKTTPIKDEEADIVYTDKISHRWNWLTGIKGRSDKVSRKILALIAGHKVFYSDNETGEVLRNFLNWSGK